MYEQLHIPENEEDDAIDAAGFTGNFRREVPVQQLQINVFEFIDVFKKENKLAELMETIRLIDRDHNGYVTSTEMDDILKIIYPSLVPYNLKPILKPYCSSANKVLLDYKLFRNYIRDGLEGKFRSVSDQPSIKPNLLNLKGKGH